MPDGPVINTNLGPTTTPTPNPLLANPFGIAKDMVEIRNYNNQNLLFQQQMSARTQFGALAATMGAKGATPDQIVEQASKEPWGVYVSPEMGAYRNLGLLSNQIEQTRALTREANSITDKNLIENAHGVYGLMGAMAISAINDPSRLPSVRDNALASLPPDIAKKMKPMFDGLVTSVLGHNDVSTPEGRTAARHDLYNVIVGTGLAPDSIFAAAGVPPVSLQNNNGVMVTGGGLDSLEGGAARTFTPPPVPSSSSSTSFSPEGVVAPIGSPQSYTWQPAMATDKEISHTGEPLTGSPQGTQLPKSIGPGSKLGREADIRIEELNSEKRSSAYEQTNQGLARLTDMRNAFESLANGGFLQPGPFGDARVKIAAAINGFERLTGRDATSFDQIKVGQIEDLIKNTKNAATNLLTSQFGPQREAAITIERMMGAVPSINNTPLGGMILTDMLAAGAQWNKGKYEFQRNYADRNAGDPGQSDVLYSHKNPPEKLVEAVLDKYGLTPQGFKSPKDLKQMLPYLISDPKHPYENYANIAHSKGWLSDKAYDAVKATGFTGAGGQ